MLSEAEIVKGCKKGIGYYQEQLYKRYSSKMFGVCLRFFRRRDEAEDCLQEGFIKVFDNIKSFEGKGSFEGWIRRIIVNTAINMYRTNQSDGGDGMGDIEDIIDTEPLTDAGFDNMSADHLLEMIRRLPDGFRQVFNLYAIEGYSHKEIALMLNISEGTSKSQLSRARTFLQDKIMKFNQKFEMPIRK
jgi:RNA polymerase sigma-70 factor (ECF subfamily)